MTTDAADAADALLEGGDSPTERRCTFMHLLLTLFSGLNEEALHMLYKAAKPAILEKEGAVQKKAYRVLLQVYTHTVCLVGQRSAWREQEHQTAGESIQTHTALFTVPPPLCLIQHC